MQLHTTLLPTLHYVQAVQLATIEKKCERLDSYHLHSCGAGYTNQLPLETFAPLVGTSRSFTSVVSHRLF